jgi:hypothetical protein
MKKKQTLLLSTFMLVAALTVAQTPPSINAPVNSQAQRLRRYEPQMRSVEKKSGGDTWYVSIEKAISPATEQALIEYFTRQYKLVAMGIDIYKAPVADNLYFVLGTVRKDKQSEDSESINIFLALREQGGIVSEVSKAENENDSLLRAPVFFYGQNKLLAIVSLSAADGSLAGHYAYEYAGNNFKPLGDIPVIDKTGMSGQVWITNNRIEGATAEYKNNTYYVTMRGKGSLYQGISYDNYKKLAPPRSPVTFFYDGKEWRPVSTRRAGRR